MRESIFYYREWKEAERDGLEQYANDCKRLQTIIQRKQNERTDSGLYLF